MNSIDKTIEYNILQLIIFIGKSNTNDLNVEKIEYYVAPVIWYRFEIKGDIYIVKYHYMGNLINIDKNFERINYQEIHNIYKYLKNIERKMKIRNLRNE